MRIVLCTHHTLTLTQLTMWKVTQVLTRNPIKTEVWLEAVEQQVIWRSSLFCILKRKFNAFRKHLSLSLYNSCQPQSKLYFCISIFVFEHFRFRQSHLHTQSPKISTSTRRFFIIVAHNEYICLLFVLENGCEWVGDSCWHANHGLSHRCMAVIFQFVDLLFWSNWKRISILCLQRTA